MHLSKETIYSDWTTSKWLYKIEEVFCPQDFTSHLNISMAEFLELLKAKMIYFLSSFTEIMGTATKKAKTALSQLILTSDKIYAYLINISKIKYISENHSDIRKLYLNILSIIESLLDDCEKLNEKLLRELPLTKYALFIRKGIFKNNVEIFKTKLVKASLCPDLIHVILNGMFSVVQRKKVKRGELRYAYMILGRLINIEHPTSENVEDLLIEYDFNSPKFFNYLAKRCTDLMLQNTGLHFQMELLISMEDNLNEISQTSSWRLEEKINDLLYDHLQKKDLEKFNKKLTKITDNGIAYGIPNDSYSYFTFNHSMEKFLNNIKGIDHIKNLIRDKIIPKLRTRKLF